MNIFDIEKVKELLDFISTENLFGEYEFIFNGKAFLLKALDRVDEPQETNEKGGDLND